MKEKIEKIISENSTEEFNKAYGNGNFISSDAIGVIADEIVKLFAIPDVVDCSTCKHRKLKTWQEPCLSCDVEEGTNYESAIV